MIHLEIIVHFGNTSSYQRSVTHKKKVKIVLISLAICICSEAVCPLFKGTGGKGEEKKERSLSEVHSAVKLIGSLMRQSGGLAHLRDRRGCGEPIQSGAEVIKLALELHRPPRASPTHPQQSAQNVISAARDENNRPLLLRWRPRRLHKCSCSPLKPRYRRSRAATR